MELNLINKKENVLLKRLEADFEVKHDKKPTPSRSDIIVEASKVVKKDKNLAVIKKISTAFGTNISKIKINFYESVEGMKKVEPAYIIKRTKIAEPTPAPKEEAAPVEEAPKEEAKPAEEAAPVEEAPVEAPKEEAKAEGE